MNDDIPDESGLVRIDITARTADAAALVVEQLSALWLTSPSALAQAPDGGIRVTIHADVNRLPEEDGYPFPTCQHLNHE
ncbi:hypothetical protein ABZ532_30345 [Streptomyces sp. NPDC019396]|uniref:hypothetical protein n=1 Tax=Streptomyces sp. NPDC019396 TaxID=3154687 RepID=UPI0033F6B7C0